MDLAEIEQEVARLDAIYRPVATKPVDIMDPDAFKNMGARIQADIAQLAVDDQAEAVLRTVIEVYAAGDDTVRAAIRRLFDRYTSFRWAAHLARDWNSALIRSTYGHLIGTVGKRAAEATAAMVPRKIKKAS